MKMDGICPYCGNEMHSGFLQSARPIIWAADEKSLTFRASGDNEYQVSHGFWDGCFAETYFCKNCDIFILEKREQPKKAQEKLKDIFGKRDE